MSVTDILVPRLAESISEATLVEWLKADGANVATDEPTSPEIDKAAVEIVADQRRGAARVPAGSPARPYSWATCSDADGGAGVPPAPGCRVRRGAAIRRPRSGRCHRRARHAAGPDVPVRSRPPCDGLVEEHQLQPN